MAKPWKHFKKAPKVPVLQDPHIVYTDGSSLGNPGPGGYGAIAIHGTTVVKMSKGYKHTTNNRMEIMAVIAALEEFGPNQQFIIATDSQYVINGSTIWMKGWVRNDWIGTMSGEPIKNGDLWKIMNELLKVNKVVFFKVKGHSGDPLNDAADALAVAAAKNNPETIDEGYIASLSHSEDTNGRV